MLLESVRALVILPVTETVALLIVMAELLTLRSVVCSGSQQPSLKAHGYCLL